VVAKPAPRRLERQASMTLAEMLADLPTCCDVLLAVKNHT
jgi:hypothetical protein